MILNVSVTEYRSELTLREIGLTRDRRTASSLRSVFVPRWFANPTSGRIRADFGEDGQEFQAYVDRYSEVAALEPWKDVELFFEKSARSGARRSNPLFYPSDAYPLLNIAAMASAAEALAGWFCETHYGWTTLIRPQGVSPDMVFQDSAADRWALVEVKSSTILRNARGRMTTEMIDLLRVLAFTKYLSPRRYCAALIMIQIVGPADVNLTSLVLEEA